VSKITPPPCIASVFGNSPGEIFGKRFWGREGYFHFPERRRFKGPTELNTAAKMMDLASFFFLLSKEMLQCSAGSLKRRRKL
ncbi:hypothetical protein, partial [Sutterella wadsworthensis]|uniref:hypothetical protein n=1 Tax=Sutterella wadsworthensis TaxID=40545 RepID=UPI003967B040